MTRQLLLIITFLLTKNIVSQTDNKLLIGELTITQTRLDNVKISDTLVLLFAKKPFTGSIKIHSDKCIYSWTTCTLNPQKKDPWCKVGTWDKNEFIVFKLSDRTITLKNITPDIGHGQQKLIIQDIKQ